MMTCMCDYHSYQFVMYLVSLPQIDSPRKIRLNKAARLIPKFSARESIVSLEHA